jgi:hypothetical protein
MCFSIDKWKKIDNDATVVTSNCSSPECNVPHKPQMQGWATAACALFGPTSQKALNPITIATTHAIADTGATSIFIMDGIDVINKQMASKLLTINLPDGCRVRLTHVCDIAITGLLTVLTGHIVPDLAIASLVSIQLLCKAGCWVIFDNDTCDVKYEGNVILQGFKDPSTDLWTLPITPDRIWFAHPWSFPVTNCAPHPNTAFHNGVNIALFRHSMQTRGKGVKFAHQSLCNPTILTLLKVVRKGFLKGCPHLTKNLILKYLNLSPVTTKGHMTRPCHSIRSTRQKNNTPSLINPLPILLPLPLLVKANYHPDVFRHVLPGPAFICNDTDKSIANIFCSGVFANCQSGIVYNNLTSNFPFMLYHGSICFLIVYHYKSNAILALPIAGLDDKMVFDTYKIAIDELALKGFKLKFNIMDNQATK